MATSKPTDNEGRTFQEMVREKIQWLVERINNLTLEANTRGEILRLKRDLRNKHASLGEKVFEISQASGRKSVFQNPEIKELVSELLNLLKMIKAKEAEAKRYRSKETQRKKPRRDSISNPVADGTS